MRVVFMGTPEFAVPCLDRLTHDGHELVGVFTQPDKPKGRKNIMSPPPVKLRAQELGIPVFQPVSMRTGEAEEILRGLSPEIVIVTAYGKILPQELLSMPERGCVNIHASLLPKYRGAAPIQWAVINGERETGITSMQMDAGLDTGDMLLEARTEIGENETAGELHDRLSAMGAQVMSETISGLVGGTITPKKQNDSEFTYAPILTKELCPIDWTRSANEIHNRIRGLSPWPVATTQADGKRLKIHASRLSEYRGTVAGAVVENEGRLIVSCGDGCCVEIIAVQADGKRMMDAAEYMRGSKIEKGTILGETE